MASLAASILRLALALLLSVQTNAAATDAQRLQALSVAGQAIQVAVQIINQGGTTVIFHPVISNLSPTSGSAGSQVTLSGSGFTATGNSVSFGNATGISNLSSNGAFLTFSIPSVANGSYSIAVSNANGTSNSDTFTVTATCQPSQCANPPAGCTYVNGGACVNGFISCGTLSCIAPTSTSTTVISNLSPTSGSIGSTLRIIGSGFVPGNNAVHFQILTYGSGSVDYGSVPATYIDSNDLSLVIPLSVAKSVTGSEMPFSTQISAGTTYYLFVSNSNGSSNVMPFTVTAPVITSCQPSQCANPPAGCTYVNGGVCVNGFMSCGTLSCTTSAPPTITSLSPNSGSIGTQLTVIGSGFTSTGNAANFGNTTIASNLSSNGTSLTFTIPNAANAAYNITVTNANGTSNIATFAVTAAATCQPSQCPNPPSNCTYVNGGACVNGSISCGTLSCM